jgi:hypothetical protein
MSTDQPPTMIEDKYIGLALAVAGSIAIGTSFIITKKVRKTRSQHVCRLSLVRRV